MRCAFTMIRLSAACRKTSVKRTDRHGPRCDDVGQNLPGAHRRQLIDIADEQQYRTLRQSPKDGPHQRHIHD